MGSIQLKLIVLFILFLTGTSVIQAQDPTDKIIYQSLAWSPDGNSIAFTAIKVKPDWSDFSANKWGLFLYDLKSKKLEKLESGVLYFSFSPDGKKLAYDKTVEKNADIYLLNLSNRTTTPLIDHIAKDRAPSWSGDGKSIVFYSDRSGHEELYSLKVKSGKIKQLTQRTENRSFNPVCSPNSNLIVYYLETGESKDQIYLTDLKGSFQTNLTNDEHHNIYPSWTYDGRILYTRDKGELMIINADGTDKKQLIDTPIGQVKMSPDGKILLISKSDGNLYFHKLSTAMDSILLYGNKIFE